MKINSTRSSKEGNVSTQPKSKQKKHVKSVVSKPSSKTTQSRSSSTSSNRETTLGTIAKAATSSTSMVSAFESSTNNVVSPNSMSDTSTFDLTTLSETIASTLGTSKTRPEIIALTTFNPIYDDNQRQGSLQRHDDDGARTDPNLNQAGKFLDDQIQLRQLLFENVVSYVKLLQASTEISETISKRKESFQKKLQSVSSDIDSLFNLLFSMEQLKQNFDFNDFFPSLSAAVSEFDSTTQEALGTVITRLFDDDFVRIKDVLSNFGFKDEFYKKFTSTKIYLQLLYNTKELLEGHSKVFLSESQASEANDSDPYKVVQNTQKKGITGVDLKTIVISTLTDSDVSTTLSAVSSAYSTFSSLLPQSDEERVALLMHLLSKEYKLSVGFSSTKGQALLVDSFGFNGSSGASTTETMFDSVFGTIVNKATDLNSSSDTTLSKLSQIVDGKDVILTFENEYHQKTASTYVPGTLYLIDSILESGKIDLTRLESFSSRLNNQITNFRSLVEIFNLLSELQADAGFSILIGNSSSYFSDISEKVRHSNLKSSDTIISLLKLSRNNAELKNLLFSYFFLRVNGGIITTDESQQLFDSFVNDRVEIEESSTSNILSAIENQVLALVDFTFQPLDSTSTVKNVSIDTIKDELENSDLTLNIIDIFSELAVQLTALSAIDEASNRTTYSRIGWKTVALMLFEAMLVIIARSTSYELTNAYYDAASAVKFTIGDTGSESSIDEFIDAVSSKLESEIDLTNLSVLSLLSLLVSIRGSVDRVVSSLTVSQAAIDRTSDLLGDPSLTQFLVSPPQIILARSFLDDVNYSLFNGQNVTSDDVFSTGEATLLVDDSVISSETRAALVSLLSQKKFVGSTADNLRLLTVGLPHGFIASVKNRAENVSDNKNSFDDRELDIIRLVVYKIDLEHQDLVFKPLKFTFELSRFVPRHGTVTDDVGLNATMDEIITAVKTIDHSFHFSNNLVLIEETVDVNNLLPDDHYLFLTKQQKREIVENHVISYLLETYVRLMTGLSLTENSFFMVSPEPKVIEEEFSSTMLLNSASTITNSQLPNGFDDLDKVKLNETEEERLIHHSKMVSTLASMNSSISSPDAFMKKLVTPKQFERVFTVPVDPDDFEIDEEVTLSTETGKESFNKLVTQGTIQVALDQEVLVGSSQFFNVNANQKYKLRERNRKENQTAFEKYFVTVETVN